MDNPENFHVLRIDVGYCHMISKEQFSLEEFDFRLLVRSDSEGEEGIDRTAVGIVPSPMAVTYRKLKAMADPIRASVGDLLDDSTESPYWGQAFDHLWCPLPDATKVVVAPEVLGDWDVERDVTLTTEEYWDEYPVKLEEVWEEVTSPVLDDPAAIRQMLDSQMNRVGHDGWGILRTDGTVVSPAEDTLSEARPGELPELADLEGVRASDVSTAPDAEWHLKGDVDFHDWIGGIVAERGPVKVGATSFMRSLGGGTPVEYAGVWYE